MFGVNSKIMLTNGKSKAIGELEADDQVLLLSNDLHDICDGCEILSITKKKGEARNLIFKCNDTEIETLVGINQEFPTSNGLKTIINARKRDLLFHYDLAIAVLTDDRHRFSVVHELYDILVTMDCMVIVNNMFFKIRRGV